MSAQSLALAWLLTALASLMFGRAGAATCVLLMLFYLLFDLAVRTTAGGAQ